MSESKFRSRIIKMLSPLCAFPVENTVADGQPDIATTAGWIELKLARRPERVTTRVSIDMRNSQQIWHRRWREHGGRSWVMTLVTGAPRADILYVHDGLWCASNLGEVPESELTTNAVGILDPGYTSRDLIHVIMKALRSTR